MAPARVAPGLRSPARSSSNSSRALAPRVVRLLAVVEIAGQSAEAHGTLRVGRGEERGELRPRPAPAEQGRLLDAGCVHHRPHIVQQDAEVRSSAHAVRHADAALVEDEHAQVARQTPQEADVAWLLPVHLEVRDPAVYHEQREGARAEVLIGDAGAVDRPGPAGLGNVGHLAFSRGADRIAWPLHRMPCTAHHHNSDALHEGQCRRLVVTSLAGARPPASIPAAALTEHPGAR